MFSNHYSINLFQSHDPSEIILICWFDAQETIIIINVLILKRVVAYVSLMHRKIIWSAFICIIIIILSSLPLLINFNASVLNRSMNCLKKIITTDPRILSAIIIKHFSNSFCLIALVKNKFFKYINFMLSILQINLYIYVLNKNALQLYF